MGFQKVKQHVMGFIDFIRERGVVGLAIGFILGGSITKVVTAFVDDIINPILGLLFGSNSSLAQANITIGSAQILWGHFLTILIDFTIIAFIVYFIFKGLGLEKLDKKANG